MMNWFAKAELIISIKVNGNTIILKFNFIFYKVYLFTHFNLIN